MRCPHCHVAINVPESEAHLGRDVDGEWMARTFDCPECSRMTVQLVRFHHGRSGPPFVQVDDEVEVVRPHSSLRPPAPPEVPESLSRLYDEASVVAPLSPRASGALARRALQQLIRDEGGIQKRDLAAEIDGLVASAGLPTHLTELLHAVRQVGNFAAHPMKSTQTGDVIDVEPGEVELVFDILDGLFDFCFVQPAVTARRKAELNAKLRAAGKPEL